MRRHRPNRPPRSFPPALAGIAVLAFVLSACGGGAPATPMPVILEPTVRSELSETVSSAVSTASVAGGTDVIFHNGVILTMDDGRPTASAIHLVGETIASLGDDAAVLAEAGSGTAVIDLAGRTLMPGFVDAHSHMFAEPDPAQVQATLLQTGVTTTAEMYVDEPLLQRLLELEAGGGLRVRLSAYLLYDTSCGDRLDEWWRAYPSTRRPGEMLRIGGIKVFTDGGSCNAPAVAFDYGNGVGQGDLYFTQPELEAALRSIDGAGYQAAVHAIGDRALDVVLGAFESLWGGVNPRRHRIEHNAVIRPDQLARYSAAQPVATIFAPFATCHKLGGETRFKYEVPDANRTWEWPWRDLISANPGLHLAWHGDMPHVYPPDAAYHLFAMVTRAELAPDGSICQPPDWIAHNALSADEALQLMTIGAAYALDRDQEVGSLVPGKFADLVVLSDNPLTVAPLALKDLQVLMTMVGGHVEYCAEGAETLCPSTSGPAPAPAAIAGFRDEFEAALEPGWTWLNEDPSGWSLTETLGWLRVNLSIGGFLAGVPSNVLLRPAPMGDFDLRTRVRHAPARNYEFAGLIVRFGDDRVLQFGHAYCDAPGACAGDGYYFDNLQAGTSVGSNFASAGSGGSEDQLRLARRGDTYSAYYIVDDATWIEIGSHTVDQPPVSVGLVAAQAQDAGAVAEFDWFEVAE
jgi:predicted amidohydrolase YtcJ